MRKKRFLYVVWSMMLLWCTACGNSARATTMQLVKSQGTVGVLDDKGADIALLENMNLYSGYHMETQKESYAWINLDRTKLTKMDADSEIEIQKNGNQLEIFVNSGNFYFHITEPLPEDETLDIRTSTMMVGIRGTCGWVEVTDETHMCVYLLEGTVECSAENEQGETNTCMISGGEKAEIANGEILVSSFTEPAIPSFVLEELLKDEELCQKIYEDSTLDILGDWSTQEPDSSLEDDDAFADDSSAEDASSGSFEGIQVPDRAEWSGNYDDAVASLSLVDISKDTSAWGNEIISWEELDNLPDVVTPFEVGIWAYKETEQELGSKYGEMAAYDMDGYEWRILTWGGPKDTMEDEILKGHLLIESTYWDTAIENSKDWNRSEDDYHYVEVNDAEYDFFEYTYEDNFTVTWNGADYTECTFINTLALKVDGEHYFHILLVRVPEGFDGAIKHTLYGNKEENGESVVNTEESVSLLF